MNENLYLKRLFQAYYKESKLKLPTVSSFNKREFGFIPWEKHVMIRHTSFTNLKDLSNYLITNTPKHVYSSGSLYLKPDNSKMDKKQYQGCDLIIDVDVDHFYTPCKDDHDYWICEDCKNMGTGMVTKCPKCQSLKIKSLTWICEKCLKSARNEIIKLIDNFLIPDFDIKEQDIKISFSGHRGYHLKIENEEIRTLSSEERREIVDYITGDNISLEVIGLREDRSNIYGLFKETVGWSHKIVSKLENILKSYSNDEIDELLKEFGMKENIIKSFLNSKNYFLQILSNKTSNLWNIEGFGIKSWETFLNGIVRKIGVEVDKPVSIDIHRLIRYPGSLHGKTGFKVQELSLDEIEDFDPLNENSTTLNPIVFESKKVKQKIEIVEERVPSTKIKGEVYGPYRKGDIVEVPHHFAVFFLCKEVAKIK